MRPINAPKQHVTKGLQIVDWNFCARAIKLDEGKLSFWELNQLRGDLAELIIAAKLPDQSSYVKLARDTIRLALVTYLVRTVRTNGSKPQKAGR